MTDFKTIERKIVANGWFLVRSNGSHYMYKNRCGNLTVTIPNRKGQDLPVGIIHSLEKITGLSLLR